MLLMLLLFRSVRSSLLRVSSVDLSIIAYR
jgi:hypothetical protein